MAERIKVFRSTFDKLCPGLYADADQSRLDGRIEGALTGFPSIRPTYDEIERKFPEALASAMKEFRGTFSDFTPSMPIYLIHSLGTRDGGTDLVAGRMVMLFGADEIAQFHWDESLQPFLVHELFHIEHIRHFADCDQLWCSLWQEGLATYTASVLMPDASDHQLILDVPHPIRQETDAHWQDALCWTAEHFDSTNPSEISAASLGVRSRPRSVGMADSALFLHGSVITLAFELPLRPPKLDPSQNWTVWMIKRPDPSQLAL